ncbi:MAG TPA: patatin-like phospholipase family protein, partial [Cytophagaceae bacterium]
KEPEQKGLIPILIASPTVINDGRKLFISSQNISYMTTPTVYEGKSFPQKTKGIEFLRFFEEQDSENLHFLSALRMSATFPYITPNVELPSSPAMEIMDAGLSDNFGIRDAIKFLFVFKNWIEENTSGVVFVNIRDSEKNREIQKKSEPSIFQKIFAPIGSLYNNWDYLQDFNNDFLLEYAQSWFKNNLDVIEFEYIPEPESWEKLKRKKINVKDVADKEKTARAALSWHLTTREKESIERTILEENNLKALIRLENLLRD